jgi:benzoate/toluate 1,2-dioxygenase beta subunit
MSSTLEKPNTTAVQLSPEDVRQFLYREVRFLDDKEWENWLALYAPNVEFWMPSWDDDDRLVTDPQTRNFADLVRQQGRARGSDLPHRDRAVGRIQPAGAANLAQHRQHRDSRAGGVCRLRFNWVTFSYRHKTVDTYFGTSFYTLDTTGPQPLITRKKVILKNDCIHHVVDIYHI